MYIYSDNTLAKEKKDMGKIIGLVACSKKKDTEAETNEKKAFPAKDLYKGRIFQQSRDYAETHCDDWFILSGKFELLKKDTRISYYNCYLKDKSAIERREWADNVLKQLKKNGFDLEKDHFVIFGGKAYYENLCKHLNCSVYKCYSGGIYLNKPLHIFKNGGK